MSSLLDPGQIIKAAYDDTNNAFRTELTSGVTIGAVSIKDATTNNEATVTAAGALKIDGSAVTQPVSASSLPLPTGAATAANQTTANTSLSTIATNTTGVATAANQSTANSSLATIATNTTGVATAANQSTANSSLSTIATNTTNLVETETVPGVAASFALTVQGNTSSIPIPVSISGSTGDASLNIDKYGGTATTLGQKAAAASIPIVIASDQVVSISATSLPLPTGAATSSNQVTGNTSLGNIDNNISARLAGSLVPSAYSEIDLTYVASGNGAGQVQTATYKLSGTTVATLTLSYNASNQLTGVVKS